jgi:hypothetical protein
MKMYKGLREITQVQEVAQVHGVGASMKTEESLFPVSGRAHPSRLAAAAILALAVLVTFMLIATSCSVARL